MSRYKLPEALGGGELDSAMVDHDLAYFDLPGTNRRFMVPTDCLAEVPPPIPPEPGPGAYLIGVGLAYRDLGVTTSRWHWQIRAKGRSASNRHWAEVWEKLGGPDVTIVPLIPDPAHGITLPWDPSPLGPDNLDATRTSVYLAADGLIHDTNQVRRSSNTVRLYPADAEAKAAALLAAARAVREATP